ncbi:EAL domain-containing protein [Aestuariicoccus sp. KMU-90]|uniref:EAL domain-containing protein n=2 Tax=Thetidibacter halocola TaxID=2827239 RepID=A0A8J7WAX6_9RHOB|nr:EAL domain-containing protein [Thetidibacter halocola]
MIAALVLLTSTVVMSRFARVAQSERVVSVVETYSRVFAAKLGEQLQNRIDVVELVRASWQKERMAGLGEFDDVADIIHAYFDEVQALNWVNAAGEIERVTPLDGNERALGLNVAALPGPGQALRDATALDAFRLTGPIELAQGGKGIVGYAPVRVNGEVAGFLNLVFRSAPLMDHVMGPSDAKSFSVTVMDGTNSVHEMPHDPVGEAFAVSTTLDIAGRTWTIIARPTSAEVAAAQSPLDELILLIGLALTVFVPALLNESALNKQRLVEREERFALAMEGASDGLFDLNTLTGETYYSPRWFQMVGYRAEELPLHFDTFRKLIHPADVDNVIRPAHDFTDSDGDIVENEFRMRHKDGHWINVLARARLVRRDGRVVRIVGTHVDLTELRRHERELKRAAMTDDLTGLRNRRGLSQVLTRHAAALSDTARLCLMHVDLDMFKAINDSNGHEAGDHVLREIADRLRGFHGAFEVIARVGGDEFLLAIRTEVSDAGLLDFAQSLITAIGQPIAFEGKGFRVGASIGVDVVSSATEESVCTAIANADIALKHAKTSGKGRCVFFEPAMRDETVRSVEIAMQIREGIDRNEFVAFFQPQVDLRSNRIVGFEALARWRHPERGILNAAAFVPHAEDAHLIEAIDDLVFSRVLDALAMLDGLGLTETRISVNLSTSQLMHASVVDRLLWKVDEASIDPQRICIEILESTLLNERAGNVVRNVHDLAKAGFSVELDDFGSGHTAIASLLNFPVSRIKIDKSLVAGIAGDRNLQAITTAISDLGQKLGVTVLAEGLETEEDRAFLLSTTCAQVQGYLVGRPLAQQDLNDWIVAWCGRHSEPLRARAGTGS